MKKHLNKKSLMVIMLILVVAVLSGCQRNVDANGYTLPEKIIYLTTSFKDMMHESVFTAILVYPLAQCVNLIGGFTGSSVLGVVLTTVLYNALILPMSIKSTVSTQKMQLIQPEMQRIQAKYEGRDDEQSRMQQAQEMQRLYNKHGINPMGSLLVPFLQMPMLFAMYYAVQRADAVCNGLVAGLPLTTTPLDAIKNIGQGWPLVLIFVLMAVSQFLSTKVPQWLATKKRKSAKGYREYKDTATNNSQANIMVYSMLVMVIVVAIRWPVAMSLYWLVSSSVNTLKTVYIQWRYVNND